MRNLSFTACALLLFAVGCNESTTGAEGNIAFTPDDCNVRSGCDFDDSIGVGGAININIAGLEGFSTAGVQLVSDDDTVLSVTTIGDVGGRPTWEAIGIAPGVARVSAIDSDGVEVDFIEVGVQDLVGFGLENFAGDAVGPTSSGEFDEIWQVNAEQATSFFVVPLIGSGVPTMGRYVFTPYLDQTFDDGLLDTENIDDGYLYFSVPAGNYPVSFVHEDLQMELNILIQAADVAASN